MADPGFAFMRKQIRANVQDLTGDVGDAPGVELAAMIRALSHLYEALTTQALGGEELSGARLGVLVRLLAEARRGNVQGVSPTYLSHCLHVSKNTVSALLRGLEEQGFIERVLDTTDRRRFLIRLTPMGERLVATIAPHHIEALNAPLKAFTAEELDYLLVLLEKLGSALKAQAAQANAPDEA